MTTADKLITVAENVPKVYHAGQLNVIENTSTLKKNVSGSAILIDDISPVTHEMAIKISSDTVADLTAVKVTRCGKNLFDGNIQVGYALTGTGDNRTVTRSGNDGCKIIRVKPNTTYCFSGDFSASKDNIIRFASFTEYPTENSVSNKFSFTDRSRVFTTTDNDNYLFIWIMVPQKTTDIAMQIEEGATATEYEQYNGQTVIANADGTVEGLTSLYPNTTLTTDTDGVIIDCEYYKDIDVDDLIERTVTTYTNPKVKIIGSYAFYNCSALTTVNFPVARSIGNSAFYGCSALTTVNFPVATSVEGNAFYSCSALTTINFPVARSIGNSAFYGCSALTTVNFPVATSVEGSAFRNCKSLISSDFPVATSVGNSAFYDCSALTALILRNSTICTLSNKNAFTGCTKITGTGGYIYVPSSLVDAYKTATNWVTYASKFRALEDYTVDGTTNGALDESKVSA